MSEVVTQSGRLILVTAHVLERLAERCALVDAEVLIQREVVEAVDEGRLACRKPRRLVPYGRRRSRAVSPSGRYAWSPDFSRVYLLIPSRRHDGHRAWTVVTVLTPSRWQDNGEAL